MTSPRVLIRKNSPLRKLPKNLSRSQVLFFDGVRYSAEMANVTYRRLYRRLQQFTLMKKNPPSASVAEAMADAWAIVDSVNRMRDLLDQTPGLKKQQPWLQLFRHRTEDVDYLRNCIQHPTQEIATLETTSQILGYLSWAQIRDGEHTGRWAMVSPGSVFRGDQYLFIGPARPKVKVPGGHIRLNAFGRRVYLGRLVMAVFHCVAGLESALATGSVRRVGPTAAPDRRGVDSYYEGVIEVVCVRNP